MKIAVLLGGISYDSQKRTINGILDKAILDRSNVYIFTCDGWKYEVPSKYEKGEYNIYKLPDFTKYDGAILNTDTIHEPDVVKEITDKISEAGIPCVDLNITNPYFMHVEMENRNGIEEIMEHLIKEHNAANIFFISGPEDSHDANLRLNAYKDMMTANHVKWEEDQIYYGDYSYESGKRAVDKFLNEAHVKPDAVVAANDEMAVGAMLALKEAGYRVPQDVMVYDTETIGTLETLFVSSKHYGLEELCESIRQDIQSECKSRSMIIVYTNLPETEIECVKNLVEKLEEDHFCRYGIVMCKE